MTTCRSKGTRVGIETVLYDYIYKNKSAKQIAESYPTLTLEKIYATIPYYLHNRQKVEAYLLDWLNFSSQMRENQAKNPLSVVLRCIQFFEELNWHFNRFCNIKYQLNV